MGYGYGSGGGGGYQQRSYQGGGGQQQSSYSKTPYTPPVKKEFNLDEEASKYGVVYLTLVEQLKSVGVSIEDVKDFLGGWTTSLKLSLDKS